MTTIVQDADNLNLKVIINVEQSLSRLPHKYSRNSFSVERYAASGTKASARCENVSLPMAVRDKKLRPERSACR